MNKKIFFLLFFIFFTLTAARDKVAALTFIDSNDFNISLSNRHPFPNEEITAQIKDVTFDSFKSYITWYLNGKIILQGKGKNEVNFKIGSLGSSQTLSATIQPPSGGTLKKSVVLNVSDFDLLWQADTYTPYFYNSKAFASPLSNIKVAAMPFLIFQGKKITSENLFFKWFLNDELKDQGFGKDSFIFKTSLFENENFVITAEVSSANGAVLQKKSVSLTPQSPQILFYEYDSLQGTKSDKALSKFKILSGGYNQFAAEPFFIPNDKFNELNYEWSINNQRINNTKPLNRLNFSSEAGQTGAYSVNLKIWFKNLLQKAENGFLINLQ